jgi:hypothetical protein
MTRALGATKKHHDTTKGSEKAVAALKVAADEKVEKNVPFLGSTVSVLFTFESHFVEDPNLLTHLAAGFHQLTNNQCLLLCLHRFP